MSNGDDVRYTTADRFKSLDVPLHPYLPKRNERYFRGPKDIGIRIMILYALAGIPNGADKSLLRDWLKENNIWSELNEDEASFFELQTIPKPQMNELGWKQESLFTLAWATRLVASLPIPDQESDLTPVFNLIPPEVETRAFLNNLVMRDSTILLQELDFYYCLDAALNHPELWKSNTAEKRWNRAVVQERRHALEWLAQKNVDWHDITLDT